MVKSGLDIVQETIKIIRQGILYLNAIGFLKKDIVGTIVCSTGHFDKMSQLVGTPLLYAAKSHNL